MDLPTLFLLLVAQQGLGYVLEPAFSWPEEYHIKAEEIDLVTNIYKNFEIWHSERHNRSRIDLFDGSVQRYYEKIVPDNGTSDDDSYYSDSDSGVKVYLVHPQVSEDDTQNIKQCDFDTTYEEEDFLPSLELYQLKEHKDIDGKAGQVWYKSEIKREIVRVEETLIVYETADGDYVPLSHTSKVFNMENGGLHKHVVLNYYNFNPSVDLEDLLFDDSKCSSDSEPLRSELKEAFHRLYPEIASDVTGTFHKYKEHHGKTYKTEEEHDLRKLIFEANWRYVKETNKKNLGYKLEMNQFADMLPTEMFRALGRTKFPEFKGTHPFPHTEAELNVADFPEDFDLRMLGHITPVGNQAHCGSCWAFAAAATMEGALARTNGRLIDLSEQSLVDCAWAYDSHGCQGTMSIESVFKYLMNHGIPTAVEYGPYLETDGVCHLNETSKSYSIRGYVTVTKNSESALKAALLNYGPVTVGIQVTRGVGLYSSGVLYDFDCQPRAMNHAVTLIGYGHRDGDLYWIIKNSWGEAWGNDGYLFIAAKDNNCNVMDTPVYPLV